MNFHQLKYIIAVDHNRNFARAAEECHIAQSTLSKEIQRLEKEYDVMIFDRSRHPVVPTMKGADLIRQAKIILEAQKKFEETALKKDNAPAGNFCLGILPGLAPYLVPLFAQQITEKYPKLNLQLLEANAHEVIDHFEHERMDGAIGFSPFPKEGYYEHPLFEEEFVLYVSRDHDLAKKERVKWKEIPLEELILQEDMKNFILEQKPHLLNPQSKGLKNVTFQNGSLETIRKIIDRNGGLTLLPQLACLYMGDRRLEMVRHIEDPVLKRTINFVAPRGFQKKRILKVILQEIVERVPKDLFVNSSNRAENSSAGGVNRFYL